jgi:hypothetical protein
MNEHNELGEEMLERVVGGLTASQVDPRGNGGPPLITSLDKPQAFLSWTHWVPHLPSD